ncbi:hypothetical protein CEXT_127671 [Caerostris extrusa]|uniref:Uncharacterized protein n=1 Tax=Caerostris extrusa TaxID=172846 RepID=A0AAV4X0Y4_CAEEX|nr:hypothetical protein CEXT_127671 [Caerostris extrusa]
MRFHSSPPADDSGREKNSKLHSCARMQSKHAMSVALATPYHSRVQSKDLNGFINELCWNSLPPRFCLEDRYYSPHIEL